MIDVTMKRRELKMLGELMRKMRHAGSTPDKMSYSSRLQKLCASGKLRRTEATAGDNESV